MPETFSLVLITGRVSNVQIEKTSRYHFLRRALSILFGEHLVDAASSKPKHLSWLLERQFSKANSKMK